MTTIRPGAVFALEVPDELFSSVKIAAVVAGYALVRNSDLSRRHPLWFSPADVITTGTQRVYVRLRSLLEKNEAREQRVLLCAELRNMGIAEVMSVSYGSESEVSAA